MEINPVIQTMLNHRSVRKYKPEQPSDEIVETIMRAGQQAPFASQLYSVLLSRKRKGPFSAPLHFIICVDIYKLERFMRQRGWELRTNHLLLLMFGIQDAAYMAENMVVAAESLGLGTCFLGGTPYMADKIAKQFKLPLRVFPLVELVMGYPDEDFPPRPRYPLLFTLFEDAYPKLTDAQVSEAMQVMDDGYLQQDYYRKLRAKISLEVEREETFSYKDYSWTEHISRKWGQWFSSPKDLLEQLRLRGFDITGDQEKA
ncbi:MAG: nitroreductase family protein [Coprothermobacterota bacterium]|nr:nitroreductase family protein [Coprothermobacterota bacterium]